MKPSIIVDERGVVLQVTNDAGEAVSVPLDSATITQMGQQLARAKAALMTPEGKRTVTKALGALFWELVGSDEDGTPKTKG